MLAAGGGLVVGGTLAAAEPDALPGPGAVAKTLGSAGAAGACSMAGDGLGVEGSGRMAGTERSGEAGGDEAGNGNEARFQVMRIELKGVRFAPTAA